MATRKIYSLYLCVDGLISKRELCTMFHKMSLEDIDQALTHFSDVSDFVSRSGISIDESRKYSLVIMSSNGSKHGVLLSQDRNFYERQISESGRLEYNNDLLDILYKYLFSSSDNKRIKESPIFQHFRNVLKNYAISGDVDFVHLDYKTLDWGFNCVRNKSIHNYRIMRDVYCYLKGKELLKVRDSGSINSSLSLQTSQVSSISDYYLYVKNNNVAYASSDFFRDKILVCSGSLKEIDEYTFTHTEMKDGRIYSRLEREKLASNVGYIYDKNGRNLLLNVEDNELFYRSEVLGDEDAKRELYYWLNLYFPLASTSDSFIRFFDQYYYDKMVITTQKLDRDYLINEWWSCLNFEQLSYEEIRAIYFAIKNVIQEINLGKGKIKRKKI